MTKHIIYIDTVAIIARTLWSIQINENVNEKRSMIYLKWFYTTRCKTLIVERTVYISMAQCTIEVTPER